MNRLFAIVASTIVLGLTARTPVAEAQAGGAGPGGPAGRVGYAGSGYVEGVVADDRGAPLAGAMVSALGATGAVAVTDKRGTFTLGLPPGSYVLRAHLTGFVPSRRQFVDVRATSPSHLDITLQRAAAANASSGKGKGATPAPPPPPPRVLAAGLAPVGTRLDPLSLDPFGFADNPLKGPDDAGETAWRIRHLPRSVLKDTTEQASPAPVKSGKEGGARQPASPGGNLARALGAPAKLLNDLPLTGQVNLMTSSSIDGGQGAASTDSALRGSAFFSVAGPAWNYGDWSARVMTQATPGSWFASGAFRNRAPSRNLYNVGFAYSSQRVVSATPSANHVILGQIEPGDRTAGLLYGAGRFTAAPRLVVDYGARAAWYDYLRGGGLLSPSVVVTVVPLHRLRLLLGAAHRQMAPGAEEFLQPFANGFWVPPEQTFVAYSPLVPERTTQFDATLEHDVTPGLSLAVRSFYQNTTDQQMVFFGDAMAAQPGHYGVANAGDVMTHGWSVGVTHRLLSRLRGSVTYELTTARWWRSAPGQELLLLGFGPHPDRERLQGLTTSLETDLPLTETHVYLAYRLNSGFLQREGETAAPAFDSRFDVQFTQRLPFLDFTSAQWQVLFVVKNVFRDISRDSSVYDELLVVKPPTRILGGFVVRF